MNYDLSVQHLPPRQIQFHGPTSATLGGFGAPAYQAETCRAVVDADPFSGGKPMLRSSLLQVDNILVVLLVAKQPAKPHRGLQSAVDHRRPSTRVPFSRITPGNECIFGRIASPGVHGEAEVRVKGEQEGSMPREPYPVGQCAMLHK